MNISLIGMPASGKTTVAKELNKILTDYSLIDTDEKIVQNEKRTINEIFSVNGEEYFRSVEKKILKEILQKDNQIISTGGGIIKIKENIELLKEKSFLIYLKADIETLIERAKTNTERPLLNCEDIKEKLELLLSERESSYQKAHCIIYIDDKTPKEEAREILEKINENSRSKNKSTK